MSPDPLAWFRSKPADPGPDDTPPKTLLGVPDPAPWLEDLDWDEPDNDDDEPVKP